MIESDHLVDQARRLIANSSKGRPRETDLRRAISSLYYAVFHALAAAAADTFIGKGSRATATYGLLYRAFEHAQLKRICEAISRSTLGEKYQQSLGMKAFSSTVQDLSATFVGLQKLRHLADYDPRQRFGVADVHLATVLAESSLANLKGISASERQVFLALLLFDARAA